MPPEPTFRRLDTTNDAELREWYRMCVSSVSEGRPHFVPKPFEEFVQAVVQPELGAERYDVVALVDGHVVAGAMVWLPTEDNLDNAWVILDVDPAVRRRGIGRALFAEVERDLPPDRTNLVIPAKVPAGTADTHPYRLWADAVGLSLSTVGTLRHLPLPVDAAHLDALDPGPRAGYRIESFVDGIDERWQQDVGWLKGLVDVDSPTGDLEWEPSPLSPEHYREELRRTVAVGGHYVESIAVHEDSGRVVGYTQLDVQADPDRPVMQEGTLVLDEHRGHRLGLALKIANLRTLARLGVPNPRISTGNDDANGPMIAINEQLGFVPTELELIFVKRR